MTAFPRRRLKTLVDLGNVKRNFDAQRDEYVGLEHIEPWSGRILPAGDTTPTGLVSEFAAGDVLFGKLRPYLAKVALATESGVASTEALVLRPRRGVHARFLRYVLAERGFIDEVSSSTFGAQMPRASWKFIGTRSVSFPTDYDQKSIADFLDKEVARIDGMIAKKVSFVHLAGQRWKSTLDHLICGAHVRVTQDSSGDFAFSGIPEGWLIQPLKYLTDPGRPITYGIVLPGPNMPDGPLIVKGGDVKPGRLKPDLLCRTTPEIESSYARSRLKAGDLVISIRGGIGDVEIVPESIDGANLTQDAARIAPRAGVSTEWLRYALMAPSVFAPLDAKSAGAAVRGINIFDLRRIKIPTPSQQEQRQIAAEATRKERQLSSLRSAAIRHRALLQELRASLITNAISGAINPAEWDRRDRTQRAISAIEEDLAA